MKMDGFISDSMDDMEAHMDMAERHVQRPKTKASIANVPGLTQEDAKYFIM